MSARGAWLAALLFLIGLPGCFDAIVGAECKPGYSPCRGACVATGLCRATDGSTAGTIPDGGDDETADAEERDTGMPAPDAGEGTADGGLTAEVSAVDTGKLEVTAPDARVDARGLPDADLRAGEAPDALDVPLPDDVPSQTELPPVLVELDADIDTTFDADDACPTCLDGAGLDEPVDVEPLDGGDAVDASDDAAPVDGEALDGDQDGVTVLVCTDPSIVCNEQCVDPMSDPENCGDCNTLCASGVCIEGTCLVCAADQSVCGQSCVTVATDPDNCGGCDQPCASGLCSNGQCEAAGTGRAIVIGHDYLRNRPAMNRILGNAVFLWPVNPVHLLVYQGAASGTAINGANAAIAQVASATGRQWMSTVAADTDVPNLLPANQVFLIYGQASASDATLAQLAQSWKDALGAFVQAGGTIIVLDAVYGNAGTTQILAQAGLFDLTRTTSSSNDVCTVIARGDALATGLPRTYLCEQNSTSFNVTDTASTITPVVADGTNPVVLHKLF